MYSISITLLRSILTHCSECYYQDGISIITDAEYDNLNNILRDLERKSGVAVPSMDLMIVTDHVDGFRKVNRDIMMTSQRDIYNEEELNKWMEDMQSFADKEYGGRVQAKFLCQHKFDGLSCSLIYRNGELVEASTRGDGYEGDDVTAQVRNLQSVPNHIDYAGGDFEVRGEIVMPFSEFDRVNKELVSQGKEPLANPRNGASGALKSLDPTVAMKRGLMFYAWDVILPDNYNINNMQLKMAEISEYFYTGKMYCCTDNLVNDFILAETEHRYDLPYPIDGVVIKLDDTSLSDNIGIVGKYPKYSVAYKFPQESTFSKLTSVDWQVAKTGKVTPVANYEPVQMNGTTCRRATLNSVQWIEHNLQGLHIGDSLELIKGGEIIPKILSYRQGSDRGIEVRRPHNCPVCGSRLIRKGANVWCENPECSAKKVEDKPKRATKSDDSTDLLIPYKDITGKKILVSGNFGSPYLRKKIERTVIARGATLAKGVSLDTDIFILPDDLESWKSKAGGKWHSIQQYMMTDRIRKASDIFVM